MCWGIDQILRVAAQKLAGAIFASAVFLGAACGGKGAPKEVSNPQSSMPVAHQARDMPDIINKTKNYTEDERAILEEARKIVKERNLDVAGFGESLSRFMGKWYVIYAPQEAKGPGGPGWEISFEYPSGKFIRVARSQ